MAPKTDVDPLRKLRSHQRWPTDSTPLNQNLKSNQIKNCRKDASLRDELGIVEEQALNDVVGDRHLFIGVGDREPEVPVAGDGGRGIGG